MYSYNAVEDIQSAPAEGMNEYMLRDIGPPIKPVGAGTTSNPAFLYNFTDLAI